MEGQGAYNRHSRVQAAGLLPSLTLVEWAAKAVPLAPGLPPIVVADYGSSAGRNSLKPMTVAIGALRERIGPGQTISVVHTDVPENDFTALFQTLATDPDSYLRNEKAVFASAVGRSFYEQILPSNSVTLGWSSWAIQWLSRAPAIIPDHVQIAYSHDPVAREAFAQQAARDWRTFLAARNRELCPGGRLVVITMALDDAGDYGYRPLLDAIVATLNEMVDAGFVGGEEARHMVIPTVSRGQAEFTAPFANGGQFADLSIEHLEVFIGEDQIWAQFEAIGDATTFGAEWAAFARAAVFPTLAAALDGGRDDKRSAQFIDRLEAGVASRLAATPERMKIPLAQMLFLKSQETSDGKQDLVP